MSDYEDDEADGDEVSAMFDKHEGEYLEFKKIPKAERPSNCPDICAFLYLERRGFLQDKGVGRDIVAGAEHDEIYLNARTDKLTEADALYLTRCGVRYDSEYQSLAMFV